MQGNEVPDVIAAVIKNGFVLPVDAMLPDLKEPSDYRRGWTDALTNLVYEFADELARLNLESFDRTRFLMQADVSAEENMDLRMITVIEEAEAFGFVNRHLTVHSWRELHRLSRIDELLRAVLERDAEHASQFLEGLSGRCPACGEVIDYCQGHGKMGDPQGYAVLQLHDRDSHTACNPLGCDEAPQPTRSA